MLPSNVDPRRPDKVQRYKPSSVSTNGQGEDLTPDYMNILGHQAATAAPNEAPSEMIAAGAGDPAMVEELQDENHTTTTSNATSVIPTSPQYGVAIIGSEDTQQLNTTPSSIVETIQDKPPDDSIKEQQSTPSRNDRFKVVKIASLEPFKRGRWKCMDYVDEVPNQQQPPKTQSTGGGNNSIQVQGGVYMQTQSLPQQQIQQILMQGGYSNGSQFFQNVPQMVPQTQYFYPQGASVPPQAQFINSQQYFQPNLVPNSNNFAINPNFPNVQYVPIQSQNSTGTFVPTSQLPVNFQQGQTYSGQQVMNGHSYNNEQQQQQPQTNVNVNLPTQTAKNLILSNQTPVVSVSQTQNTLGGQPQMQQQQFQQPPVVQQVVQTQNFENTNNVYTNPQFANSVNSLLENVENSSGENLENANNNNNNNATATGATVVPENENPDDPAKTNPVVNAIDNKIEQAMDLVKSHLMYTVREEVEVLKEKIAELMERIQQLETENNYLRSQIPKNQVLNLPAAPPPLTTPVCVVVSSSTNTISSGGGGGVVTVNSGTTTIAQPSVVVAAAATVAASSNNNNATSEV